MSLRYIRFWAAMIRCALTGGRAYYVWLAVLAVFIVAGGTSWMHHLSTGLVVTNMTDSVSWGIGIANFVFFVGIAAAAAVLVVPAYAFHRDDVKTVVLIGELLAFNSVLACMLFIATDLGHPERMWHLIPPIGLLNLPSSLLSWDVIVFNVYLFLNLHIPGYLLYKMYLGEKPWWPLYLPFVFLSMFWAVSIHTVTAFLLAGLASRTFWSSAILAPRFLISAFASGPAFLYLLFHIIDRYTNLRIKRSVLDWLVKVMRVTTPTNLFLMACDLFIEFYPGTQHSTHAQYLYFGLHGHSMLPKFIWTAITMNVTATLIFQVAALRERKIFVFLACAMTICGIWIEKGMGLIFPGFTPNPLGEIVEYRPNLEEILVSLAVLAGAGMLFTLMVKVAIAIQTGELREPRSEAQRKIELARAEYTLSVRPVRRKAPVVPRPEIPWALKTPRERLGHRIATIFRRS